MAVNDIRAGGAFIELSTRNQKMLAGLRAASARLKAFGGNVAMLGRRFLSFGLLAAGGLAGSLKVFSTMGDDIAKMAQRVGVGTDALQELIHAANLSGASTEDLEVAMRNMSRTVGSGGMALDTRLEQMADHLAGIPDPADRAAEAMRIFGRSGTMLLPMLQGGSAALREMRQEAHRLGFVLSPDDLRNAEALNDAIGRVAFSVKRFVAGIGAALAPTMTDWSNSIAEAMAPAMEWLRVNRGLVVAVGALTLGLLGLGAAMIIVGPAITIVGVALGVVASTISFVLTPLGAVTAALVAGGAAWLTWTDNGQRAVSAVASGLSDLRDTASTTFGGMMDALAMGEFEEAFRVMTLGGRIAWLQFTDTLKGVWEEFSNWCKDTLIYVLSGSWVRDLGEKIRDLLFDTAEIDARARMPGQIVPYTPAERIVDAMTNNKPGGIGPGLQAAQEQAAAAAAAQAAPARPVNPEIAALQRELAELTAQLRERRQWQDFERMWAQAEFGGPGGAASAGRGIASGLRGAAGAVEATGTFSGAAASLLGAGSSIQTVRDEETHALLRGVRQDVQGAGGIAVG